MNIFEQLRKSKHKNDNDFDKEWTVADLVKAMNAISSKKIDRNKINRIENGTQAPTADDLILYSKTFNVSTDYLLGISAIPSVDENLQMIGNTTGLSDKSINILKEMSEIDRVVVNALIERGDILLLRYAIENFYRQSHQKIKIVGIGNKELSNEESDNIFQFLSNKFINDIFSHLIHDRTITNYFMQNSINEYYNALEKAIEENNSLYEQTDERKNFINQVKINIENLKQKNIDTDYYNSFTNNKSKKKSKDDN